MRLSNSFKKEYRSYLDSEDCACTKEYHDSCAFNLYQVLENGFSLKDTELWNTLNNKVIYRLEEFIKFSTEPDNRIVARRLLKLYKPSL